MVNGAEVLDAKPSRKQAEDPGRLRVDFPLVTYRNGTGAWAEYQQHLRSSAATALMREIGLQPPATVVDDPEFG